MVHLPAWNLCFQPDAPEVLKRASSSLCNGAKQRLRSLFCVVERLCPETVAVMVLAQTVTASPGGAAGSDVGGKPC